MAVRSKPQTSSAVEGITTRSPGMGENHFTALAVIDGAAGKISADGDPNDDRGFEVSAGAPPNGGEFITQLHHGRPDVIEKLNFRNWFQAAGGHADGAADDIRLGQGRIENASRTE